jgi:hypothetical protein
MGPDVLGGDSIDPHFFEVLCVATKVTEKLQQESLDCRQMNNVV